MSLLLFYCLIKECSRIIEDDASMFFLIKSCFSLGVPTFIVDVDGTFYWIKK